MDIRKFFQAPPAKAPRTDPETPIEPPSCSSPIIPSTCEPKIDPLDIGNAVNRRINKGPPLSDQEKYAFITSAWMPNISKKIAFHQRDENKRYYLHREHLETELGKCFSYSELLKGLFCRPCVLFRIHDNAYHNVPVKQFVTEPFTSYSYLYGLQNRGIPCHINTDYHKDNVARQAAFVEHFLNPELAIDSRLYSAEDTQKAHRMLRK